MSSEEYPESSSFDNENENGKEVLPKVDNEGNQLVKVLSAEDINLQILQELKNIRICLEIGFDIKLDIY